MTKLTKIFLNVFLLLLGFRIQLTSYGNIRIPKNLGFKTSLQFIFMKFESDELDVLQRLSLNNKKVLEIGGGIGYLANCINKKNTVSEYVIIEALQENISIIGSQQYASKADVIHAAVVSEDYNEKIVRFGRKRRIFGSGLAATEDSCELEVPAIKLSSLDVGKFDVIIVDIEGAEDNIIPELCKYSSPYIVFEYHREKSKKTLGEIFQQCPGRHLNHWSGCTFILTKEKSC